MGIYLLRGANECIRIMGNTIEAADAECIFIESASAFPARKCLIANNVIRDGAFSGISLQSLEQEDAAAFSDCTITGNIIENTSAAADYAHQIRLDRVRDSVISGNRLVGYLHKGVGINFYNTCPRNQVTDNHVSGAGVGILCYSADGALKNNQVYDCATGIGLAHCRGASIVGNTVKECKTGISYGTAAAPLRILGNSILDCEDRYKGDVTPEVLTHSGVANSGDFSSFVTTGTLKKGKCTVVFDRVYQGDRFLVLPAPYESVGAGAMYVAGIDDFNSTVLVKSTDPHDERPFTLIKMVSGG